ncbi:prolyl-tRNA synthetase [Anaeramoeba flamelloides]|uniref:proline--tRNA ligase n=2 Tax=Anaeramoeba flamelloides TaxID=1746091 RepID=A0AAV7YSU4_9EUKA|nr:prolyl-tRNA synthetase [Anaeramoeba flamelloides]
MSENKQNNQKKQKQKQKQNHNTKKQRRKKAGTQKTKQQSKVTFSADKLTEFSIWYENILEYADIVDKRYPIKGMPVFKPYGCFMQTKTMDLIEKEWESQDIDRVKFPTMIPETFLNKEQDHIKGFGSQCFWVTHGGLDELNVRLALRPTSETAMYSMFSLWIRSHNDLPLRVYQTCDVFRYETKQTRPLIRVREIPFNEVHTVHSSVEDALQNLEDAWKGYYKVINDQLGIYGLRLRRPDWDKFAGAEHTDVLDSVMPSGKVLQAVGAHYLGQKFAKPFDIKFTNKEMKEELGYMTCYGVSSRLLATVIGVHGDNKGLNLPSTVARYHVVIVPILARKSKVPHEDLLSKAEELSKTLQSAGIRCKIDNRQLRPGEKYYFWEMKGVPIRLELGQYDYQKNEVRRVLRINSEKVQHPLDNIVELLQKDLKFVDETLNKRALEFHNSRVTNCSTIEEMQEAIKKGGFARIPYYSVGMDGKEGDKKVHELTGGEVRGTLVGEEPPEEGTLCLITNKPAKVYAYVARSY